MQTRRNPIYIPLAWFLFGAILVAGIFSAIGMILSWNQFETLEKRGFAEYLLVFVIAAEGAFALVHFRQEKAHQRVELLDALFREFDTKKAREARKFIYHASPDQLRLEYLVKPDHRDELERVERTLAAFDRLAYRVLSLDIESDDAYELWGGPTLAVAQLLWHYIEDQRLYRMKEGAFWERNDRFLHRRALEKLARQWAVKYAKELGPPLPGENLTTSELLSRVVEE
jgi:hypothetical protein